MTNDKPSKTYQDAINKLSGLIEVLKYSKENLCTNKVDGKDCADQGLPFSSFCKRCTEAWNMAGKLDNLTGEEAYTSGDI